MDALSFFSKKAAIFLTLALLAVAPKQAAAVVTLVPNSTQVSLSQGQTSLVQVTASDFSNQGFTVSVVYNTATGGHPWLLIPAFDGCLPSPGSYNYTTPTSQAVEANNSLSFAAGCQQGSLSPGTYIATVTLTPTNNAVTGAQITVTYSNNGGGGGAGLQVSPTSLTFCPTAGNIQIGYVTLSTTSGTAIPFTVTSPNPAPWLSVSPSSGSVISGGSQQLTVTASAASLSNGTTTSTLIPISYNGQTANVSVGITVGGTCSSNLISVNPSTTNLSYTSGGGSQTLGPFTVSTAASIYSLTATAGGWISVTTNSNGSGAGSGLSGIGSGAPFYVVTNGNIGLLSTGGYQNTVTVTDTNNNTTFLYVNLSVNGGSTGISVAPNPVTLGAALGQTSNSVTTVTVTSSVGGTVLASVAGTGLTNVVVNSPQTIASGGSTTVTLFGYAGGLGQGTYPGTLTITITNGSNQTILGPQAFPVNFQVGSGTGVITSAAAPTLLQFNYESTLAPPPSQAVIIGGSSTFNITTTMNNGTGWLSTNWVPAQNQAPQQILVMVDPSALSAGNYSGTLTISFSDGTQQQVAVNLNVVSAAPLLYAIPGSIIFTQGAGPTSTAVYLYATDGSSIPVSVTTSTPWLTFASTPPTATGGAFTLQADLSSLPNGITMGSVTVSSGVTTLLTIPVVAYVTGSSVTGSGFLTFSPATNPLTFSAAAGSTTTHSILLGVGATSYTYFTAAVSEQTCTSTNWLTVNGSNTAQGYTFQDVTIAANPSGLTAGTCIGSIQFNANGLTQSVGVTLSIGGAFTVTPNPATGLSFSYTVGGSTPAAESLILANSTGAAISYVASEASSGDWISLAGSTSTSGSVADGTSSPITVSLNTANLTTAGNYSGTITVKPGGLTAISVPVSLTVIATTITASNTPLNFSYQVGGATPAPQTVAVSGGSFSATASSSGSWLVVTPTSGTTATNISVSINPSSLTTAGSQTGSITIAGTNGTSGSVTINVTVTVTAPLPTISFVQNAASGATGGTSPGEVITISGTAMGPANAATLTLDSNGKVSTSIGGVTVTIGGTAAPLIYVSNTQINAIVPYEVSGLIAPSVIVKYLGQTSNGFTLQGVAAAPGIFSQNNTGTGPGAILNQDNSVNGPNNPAARSTPTQPSVVQVFMTGEGITTPVHVTGKVNNNITSISQLPVALLPVSATVGTLPAAVTFSGEAPNFVSGVMQVNVMIPNNVGTGNLPIVITLGVPPGVTYPTQTGITVSVK